MDEKRKIREYAVRHSEKSLREVGARFGVEAPTVRKAIEELEEEMGNRAARNLRAYFKANGK
jgi:predicted ArsR family transcriptional regulator